jgi:hypothetical protein
MNCGWTFHHQRRRRRRLFCASGAGYVATPLQPDKKQMPKRSLGNTISDMDLKEVMTHPAPDAQKSRRRRLR